MTFDRSSPRTSPTTLHGVFMKAAAIALGATLLAWVPGSPAWGAVPSWNDMVKEVPKGAETWVAVDLHALMAHPAHGPMRAFAREHGLGPPELDQAGACLGAGKEVRRLLLARKPGGRTATLLAGEFDRDCTVSFYRRQAGPKVGKSLTHHGVPLVSLAKGRLLAFVGKDSMALGDGTFVRALISRGKSRTKRLRPSKRARRLLARAVEGTALAWAASMVPERVRKRLRASGQAELATIKELTWAARGTRGLRLEMVARTTSATAARTLVMYIRARIGRELERAPLLKFLGFGTMLKQDLTITADGSRVRFALALSNDQVSLLARYGGKIISLLK